MRTLSMDTEHGTEERMNKPTSTDPDRAKLELQKTILATIESDDRPLTAAELYTGTRSQFPGINYRTVHDAVTELVRAGKLRVQIRAGRLRRYKLMNQPVENPEPRQLYPEQGSCSIYHPEAAPSCEFSVPIALSRVDCLRHIDAIDHMLRAIEKRTFPDPYCVVFPPGLDRSTLRNLPFRVRTRNCLTNAGLFQGNNAVMVGDLTRIRNFGRGSLQDLLLVVERFIKEHIPDADANWTIQHAPNGPTDSRSLESEFHEQEANYMAAVGELISPLMAAALEFQGATTLADILSPEILQLASTLDLLAKAKEIDIESIVDSSARPSSIIFDRSSQIYDSMKPKERTILDLRILPSQRKTLSEVAAILGNSKERVRQIQVKLEQKIEASLGGELHTMSKVMKAQLGPMVRERDVDLRVDRLFIDRASGGGTIARHAVKARLGYERTVNGVCLDACAIRVVTDVKSTLIRSADDAGIVDEKRGRSALSGHGWFNRWSLVLDCCGLQEIFGSLALRETARARVKAAIIAAGEPVTRDEIAERCGLTAAKTGAALASLPSLVRADKSRWGLAEWIDDEYEGIPTEIVQRIQEDGGLTTAERLFEELPRKFGVSVASVQAYLQTAKFAVSDGHVSLADSSSIRLRHLDDVIDGRDNRGAPYWTFEVHERHLAGYSLAGVPPELAKFAGCAPDSAVRVNVASPPGCGEVSVRWPLASIAGATIGYLAEPLRRLGIRGGNRVRITIDDARSVELTLESAAGPRAVSSARSIVERMKRRRKVL